MPLQNMTISTYMGKNRAYLQRQKSFWEVSDPEEQKFNRVDTLTGSDRTDAVFHANTQERVDWLLDKNPLPRDANILEIGFGIGAVLEELSKRLPSARFWGIDISKTMLATASGKLKGERFQLRLADGDNLSGFTDQQCDFVICTGVFIHIHDVDVIKNYLREAARVLKPGREFRFNIRHRNLETSFSNTLGGRLAKFAYRTGLLSSYRTKWKISQQIDFDGLVFTLSDIERLVTDAGLHLEALSLRDGNARVTAKRN